ncbi:MAG: ATP-binding protein [Candidatus Shikimatogenerans sp. Ttur]|uniref:ATP-binding protein n=1 Tax=Candidatus Shikimatogenerans sp. Ttur TaxID=3158569 RepID=A0AAU7ZXF0_9FLAO
MNKIILLKNNLKNKIFSIKKVKNISFIIIQLLKNSIDAKSKNIDIYLKKYGYKYIKIIDDGIGMSFKDLLLCYKLYYTSKIISFKDFKNNFFFGYKGESLFWISYISRILIFTKKKKKKLGQKIYIEYGKVIYKKKSYKKKEGTIIIIKDIFYNISFRKKYIKYSILEFKNIINNIIKLILPFKIKISLYNNNKLIFSKPIGNFKKNVYFFFKKKNIIFLKKKIKNIIINIFYFINIKNKYLIYFNKKLLKNKYIIKYIKKIFKKFFLYKKIFCGIFIINKKKNDSLKFLNFNFLKEKLFVYIYNVIKKYFFLKKLKILYFFKKKYKKKKIKYLYELYNNFLLFIYNNKLLIINKKLSIKNILFNIKKINKKFLIKQKIIIKKLNIKFLLKNKKKFLNIGIKYKIKEKLVKIIYFPKFFKKKYIIFFFKKFKIFKCIKYDIYYYIYNFIFKFIKKYYLKNKKKILKDLFKCKIYFFRKKGINLLLIINYFFIKNNIY